MPRTARTLLATVAAVTLAVALTTTATVAAAAPAEVPPTTGTGLPAAASGAPSPTATALCPDPGAAPTGVRAYAGLVDTAHPDVQATLTWTPLVVPANCGVGRVEIEQVSPPGPTTTVPSADGQTVLRGLTILTPYTWRLRYVAGTVSQWATVSVPAVLPLDYCLGLPGPRPITGTTPSPTTVHLEWGGLSYPALCDGKVVVTALGSSTPVANVDRAQTGTTLTGLAPGSTTTWVVSFMGTPGILLQELGRVTVTQPGAGGARCSATAHLDSVWGDGFVTTVTVTNTGPVAIGGWSAAWPLPAGVRVWNTWNASTATAGGTLTATNTSWNGALAPGASTTFGMQAARSGSGAVAVPSLTCMAR